MKQQKRLSSILFWGVFICIISFEVKTTIVKASSLTNYKTNLVTNRTIPENRIYSLGLGVVETRNLVDKPYLIASGSIGTYVYDSSTLQPILSSTTEIPVTFYGSTVDGIHAFAWSPNELTLALGASNGEIYLWDVQNHQPLRLIKYGEAGNIITGLAWSSDGNTIAAQIMFDSISLWNINTGSIIQNFENRIFITSSNLTFSPNGSLLASVGNLNSSAVIWDLGSAKLIDDFKTSQEQTRQWSVAFSPDNSMLATGSSNGEVTLQDIKTGKVIRVLEGLPKDVNNIYWSPDGDTIVASSTDLLGYSNIDMDTPTKINDAVIIWNIKSGQIQHLFANQSDVALSHDGVIFASLTPPLNQLLFQDISSGEILKTLAFPTNTFNIQWSFDDSMLASTNAVVTLWGA